MEIISESNLPSVMNARMEEEKSFMECPTKKARPRIWWPMRPSAKLHSFYSEGAPGFWMVNYLPLLLFSSHPFPSLSMGFPIDQVSIILSLLEVTWWRWHLIMSRKPRMRRAFKHPAWHLFHSLQHSEGRLSYFTPNSISIWPWNLPRKFSCLERRRRMWSIQAEVETTSPNFFLTSSNPSC